MQTIPFADTLSWMSLFHVDNTMNLGVRPCRTLAQEIHIQNIIIGEELPKPLQIINENDWTGVPPQMCPDIPIKDKCNCIPDTTTEDMCCIDDSCSLHAMHIECGSNCNVKD